MIVVNPTDTTHNLIIIPRRYSVVVDVFLRNENTNDKEVIIVNAVVNSTYLIVPITKEFKENDSFEIEITDVQGLIFRGKIFATAQTDIQNYKIDTDIIRYE